VYASKGLRQLKVMVGTVPPDERKLGVFDDSISLRLRVTGTRGQSASGWVKLGFQRPEWNYDGEFFMHQTPLAEITLDQPATSTN
jgi:hypothetical protein